MFKEFKPKSYSISKAYLIETFVDKLGSYADMLLWIIDTNKRIV